MSEDTLQIAAATSSHTSLSTECESAKVPPPRKGLAFWMAFLAVLVSLALSVLDMCATPTALPTIIEDLQGGDKFIWVGAAYGLSSTAVLMLCGRFADIFGRRPVMLVSIGLFALGSALAGAAQNMDMMIAARVIQGLGGGSIYTMSQIITSDLVSLSERASYQAALVAAYGFSGGVGPLVGGALADKASWRWIFYINLPLTGLAFAMVAIFLRVQTPPGTILTKLSRVDWLGNALIAAGSTLTLIGLVWGGVHYPWDSVQVLAPLTIGVFLMVAFLCYEVYLFRRTLAFQDAQVTHPATMPLDILNNRTSFSGYLSTFCHGVVSIAAIYYVPVFFQACQLASPIRSGVHTLPISFMMPPFAILCGVVVKITKKYVFVNLIGWVLTIVGFGLLTLLKPESSTAQWVGFLCVVSAGLGITYASTVFPILAPLPVSRNAAALSFFTFCRTFAQTWGITISGVILQNQLKEKLPNAFLETLPEGVDISFAAIPIITTIEEPLRSQVQTVFAESLSTVWKAMIAISGLGFLGVFLMREIPMPDHTDERYALDTSTTETSIDEEKAKPTR